MSHISNTETQTRCMLTWQEFDHSLWLATLASAETLAETQRVGDAKAFVEARAQLVLGFSDQIPLWAKASGRRAIFAQEELHASEHKADFSEVRMAISELMHEDGSASFALGPLAPVARKLSFGETSEKQLVEAQPGDEESEPPQVQDQQQAQNKEEPQPQPKPQHEPQQQPQEARLPPGSLTLKGQSQDEGFRITYEARQLLLHVCSGPTTEIVGEVAKGLLVVPGQWARLSNISASGTWVKTGSFSVGETVITHTQGHSVGRILEAYRKLRASDQDLVSQVEIMSQAASNVDSVILAWCIEAQAEQYPATLWQRDCFSSVFSDTAAQSMYVANQLSCLVAEKCTSKLQLTDTDFSKQFKAQFRQKLGELRSQWQELKKDSDELWKVGPLEILTSVVAAQSFMKEKNLRDQRVLRGAVRNGFLVWRPNPQTGKLEELLSQPWAKEAELSVGTKRYPGEWLQDRLKWLDSERVPRKPDWHLSETAKAISDLMVWDYYNLSEDQDEEDAQPLLDIQDEVVSDLQLELENSLSLTIKPALRRAALRRLGTKEYQSKQKVRKVKASEKKKGPSSGKS